MFYSSPTNFILLILYSSWILNTYTHTHIQTHIYYIYMLHYVYVLHHSSILTNTSAENVQINFFYVFLIRFNINCFKMYLKIMRFRQVWLQSVVAICASNNSNNNNYTKRQSDHVRLWFIGHNNLYCFLHYTLIVGTRK